MIDMIMAYESGEMSEPDIVRFFAELVKTGMAWSLQGSYGRTASSLIQQGIIDDKGNICIPLEAS